MLVPGYGDLAKRCLSFGPEPVDLAGKTRGDFVTSSKSKLGRRVTRVADERLGSVSWAALLLTQADLRSRQLNDQLRERDDRRSDTAPDVENALSAQSDRPNSRLDGVVDVHVVGRVECVGTNV